MDRCEQGALRFLAGHYLLVARASGLTRVRGRR